MDVVEAMTTTGRLGTIASRLGRIVLGADMHTPTTGGHAPQPGSAVSFGTVAPAASATVETLQEGDGTHNEIQQLTIVATGGTWTLAGSCFESFVAFDLSWDVPADDIRSGIQDYASVSVVKVGNVYTVEFIDWTGLANWPQMTADASGLTNVGGPPTPQSPAIGTAISPVPRGK